MANVRILSESAWRASRSTQLSSVPKCRLIVGIGEEIDEQRDPAPRLVQVTIDRVPDVALVTTQRRHR